MDYRRLLENSEVLLPAFLQQSSQCLDGMPATLVREMNKQLMFAWLDVAAQSIQDPRQWAERLSKYQLDQMKLWLDLWVGGTTKRESVPAGVRGDRRFQLLGERHGHRRDLPEPGGVRFRPGDVGPTGQGDVP